MTRVAEHLTSRAGRFVIQVNGTSESGYNSLNLGPVTASAWGRVGAVTMLLVFGQLFAIHGKSLLFLIIDPILITALIVVLCVGPPTRGKPLQEASFGAAENL
jgi:hypothetical protein